MSHSFIFLYNESICDCGDSRHFPSLPNWRPLTFMTSILWHALISIFFTTSITDKYFWRHIETYADLSILVVTITLTSRQTGSSSHVMFLCFQIILVLFFTIKVRMFIGGWKSHLSGLFSSRFWEDSEGLSMEVEWWGYTEVMGKLKPYLL